MLSIMDTSSSTSRLGMLDFPIVIPSEDAGRIEGSRSFGSGFALAQDDRLGSSRFRADTWIRPYGILLLFSVLCSLKCSYMLHQQMRLQIAARLANKMAILYNVWHMTDKKKIKEIYAAIAGAYRRVNSILTLGLDCYWRKVAVRIMAGLGGNDWLDVCCGTGDMTELLAKTDNDHLNIYASDFSKEMLTAAEAGSYPKKISFKLADARDLPFEDNSLDQIVISFATRNIGVRHEDLIDYFTEFRRVIRPGGHFINLETSQPRNFIIRSFFHFYAKFIIPALAKVFSGETTPYRFLSRTIVNFLDADELKAMLLRAGFSEVSYTSLTFGVCAIHVAKV